MPLSPPGDAPTESANSVSWAERIVWFALLAFISLRFGPALVGNERLAFRDVGHFYTPLYAHLADRERREWLPLYNPLDAVGMPLAGETTTALFYPPRRLIHALVGDAEQALAWYVVIHLLLAAATAGYAARLAGASRQGSAWASLVYPLAGPILFLACNPPFLVGAAWMPLALASGFRLQQRFTTRDWLLTAVGLAMPILGGDPQVSIHVVLIGFGCWLLSPLLLDRQRPDRRYWYSLAATSGRLVSALLLAILLAAPQIAASADWARQSIRYVAGPTSETYDFSVAPWHWLELVIPFLSGQLFPIYTRISHLLPGDGRTWAVTLHTGLLPLVWLLVRYRRLGWRRLDRWDWLLPIGLIGSLGGSYWLLVNLVPGYSGFRYPAKWLVFASLGIAIAVARTASGASRLTLIRTRRALVAVLAIGLLASTATVLALEFTPPDLLLRQDSQWGPLNHHDAIVGVTKSLTLIFAIGLIAFAVLHPETAGESWRRRRMPICLALTAANLCWVGWPLIATVDRVAEANLLATWQDAGIGDRPVVTELSPANADNSNPAAMGAPSLTGRAMRLSRLGWSERLRHTRANRNDRMLMVEAGMRATRYGRWHVAEPIAVFNSVTSLPAHRVGSFWRAANGIAGSLPVNRREAFWDRVFRWLAVDRAWTTAALSAQPAANDRNPRSPASAAHPLDEFGVQLKSRPIADSAAMVEIVTRWRSIPSFRVVPPARFAERLRELASEVPTETWPLLETPRDPIVVQASDANSAAATVSAATQTSPGEWRIDVRSEVPAVVCIRQFDDGNFRARYRRSTGAEADRSDVAPPDWQPATIHRCDYLFSGIRMPPGDFELVVSYSPGWLIPSLIISATAWCGVFVLGLAGQRQFAANTSPKRKRVNQ